MNRLIKAISVSLVLLGEQAQGLVHLRILELFNSSGLARGRDGFQNFEREANKGKDVSRRVVASICVAVLAEDDVFVFDA